MIYLVKDLDLISQFETGIKSIEPKPFNLFQIVNNVFELLEIESKKNSISLVFDKEYSEEITVIGDEERIQQVITNLVTNSIKYGVINGTTEISFQELNKEKIIVRITDNGLGIGKKVYKILLNYSFKYLNVNRVWLQVLSTNKNAISFVIEYSIPCI